MRASGPPEKSGAHVVVVVVEETIDRLLAFSSVVDSRERDVEGISSAWKFRNSRDLLGCYGNIYGMLYVILS